MIDDDRWYMFFRMNIGKVDEGNSASSNPMVFLFVESKPGSNAESQHHLKESLAANFGRILLFKDILHSESCLYNTKNMHLSILPGLKRRLFA